MDFGLLMKLFSTFWTVNNILSSDHHSFIFSVFQTRKVSILSIFEIGKVFILFHFSDLAGEFKMLAVIEIGLLDNLADDSPK